MTTEPLPPKVSVCVITYNHVRFIGDCLRSVVEQETNFPFEVVVADDCSTDGTSEIVDDYARRYPELVRVLRPERNLGGTQNFLALHNSARGQYVAHLDGDDLALPGKLAKQVALLDERPGVVLCGHRVGVISELGIPTGQSFPARLATEFGIQKVIRCGMPFVNSTVMYRREARKLLKAEFEVFDWYFLTDILKSGRAAYVNEEMGMYRVNFESFTSSMKRANMRGMMFDNYRSRLVDIPKYKSDLFANVLFDLLYCVGNGDEIVPVHWNLLKRSFTILGLIKVFDTFIWRWENSRALAR